jgi:hypothetical protein
MLAVLFTLPWYEIHSPIGSTGSALGLSTSFNGWEELTTLRWLFVLTIASAFLLVYFQATRRSPALPATFSVIVTVLGGLTALALIYRVLINVPGLDSVVQAQPGAYLGLASACLLACGAYLSMRKEGTASRDEPAEIETVHVSGPTAS